MSNGFGKTIYLPFFENDVKKKRETSLEKNVPTKRPMCVCIAWKIWEGRNVIIKYPDQNATSTYLNERPRD